jgi:hypothetical protein
MAGSGLNSFMSAESRDMRIRSVTASSVNRFRQSVLITFNKENPLSHSTECAGIDNSKSTSNKKTPAASPNSLLICSQLSDFALPYLQTANFKQNTKMLRNQPITLITKSAGYCLY